jgi:purine-binding chemotaxis protein CheW
MSTKTENQNKKEQILRARAESLARPPETKTDADGSLEVIEFGLAHERYALETAFVREACPLEELTPVPCTPSFVRGLVNLRGRILTVIDLKKFFGLPEQGITDLHRILFIQSAEMEVGILADMIVGLRRIPLEVIQPSLPTLSAIGATYLKGVTNESLVILDASRILTDPKIIVREEVELDVYEPPQ